jgi:hypothetical protein
MTDKFHNTVLRQIADGTPYTAVDVFGGPIRSGLTRRVPSSWHYSRRSFSSASAVGLSGSALNMITCCPPEWGMLSL